MPPLWELQNFGSCIAEWLSADDPPVEWRKPVNEWVGRLRTNPVESAEQEPAIGNAEWNGWSCEIPGASDRAHVTACFYRVSKTLRIVRCLTIATAPKFHE